MNEMPIKDSHKSDIVLKIAPIIISTLALIVSIVNSNYSINEPAPSFFSYYIEINSDLINPDSFKNSEVNNMPINFPIQSSKYTDSVLKNSKLLSNNGINPYTTCLVFYQNGKRMAQNIKIEGEYIRLKHPIEVFSNSTLYESLTNYKKDVDNTITTASISIGELDTGQGRILPIYTSYYDENFERYVVDSIFIPKAIIFQDSHTKKYIRQDIRTELDTEYEISIWIKGKG